MNGYFRSIVVLFLTSTFSIFAKTTVNGRFVLVHHNLSMYTVKFQINTSTGTDTLGCSTIIFNFDNTALSYPESPIADSDYSFLNFNNSSYNSTVTRPLPNQIWINIESLNANTGTVVAKDTNWTDVVQFTFKVLNHTGSSNLTWQTADNNWAIYDVDNSTVWAIGTWTNENTTPLPVELTNFSANVGNSNEVSLHWETATELNDYGFEVERGVNGSNKHWEKIGFVNGHEQSDNTELYKFTDYAPDNPQIFYRLKQINTNGSFKYSDEIEVHLAPDKFKLYQNYPNPFNPSTTIKYFVPYTSHINISIFDITGEKITNLVNEVKSPGTYSIDFNAANLSSGVYFYRIISDNFKQIKKMILLK